MKHPEQLVSRRIPCKLLTPPVVWSGICLLMACIATNLIAEEFQSTRASGSTIMKSDGAKILREGTRIETRLCLCRSAGDRLVVEFEDEKRSLIALENLAAQRILKSVVDDTNDSEWMVTGQITEFREHNYILLERATRASSSQ